MGRPLAAFGYKAGEKVSELIMSNTELINKIIKHQPSTNPLDYEVFIRTVLLPAVVKSQAVARELEDIYREGDCIRRSEKN